MSLKNIKEYCSKHLFTVIVGGFVFYCCFFDDHSLLKYMMYKRQEAALQEQIDTYREIVENYRLQIQELSTDDVNLEKFARERLYMKRKNEDVYVIK